MTTTYRERNGRRLHVDIAEKALGKPLPRGAEVHHADGDTHNNQNSNLVICQGRAYHMLLHARMRIRAAGGNPDAQRICYCCKKLVLREDINKANACRWCHRENVRLYKQKRRASR